MAKLEHASARLLSLALAATLVGCSAAAGPGVDEAGTGRDRGTRQDGGPRRDGPSTRPDRNLWDRATSKDGPQVRKDKQPTGPDRTVPGSDKSVSKYDKYIPVMDKSVPKPDKFVPKPDKFVPKPDKFVPKPDKFVPKPDQFVPKPDQFVPSSDIWPPPTGCASVLGKACTQSGNECGSAPGVTCLLTSSNYGVCACDCTPDDPSTPSYNEDSCPNTAKNICGRVTLTNGTTKDLCFRKCTPKLGVNACDGDLACLPRSTTFVPSAVDQAVCAYRGCTSGADCPVVGSQPCGSGGPTCPSGQLCMLYSSGTTQGRCAVHGSCDAVSNLCASHNKGNPAAKVGDPCGDDTDCAGNMTCLLEQDTGKLFKGPGASCGSNAECCNGRCQGGFCASLPCTVDFRNGYCTIEGCKFGSTLTHRACPKGSGCNMLYTSGLCQRTCDLTNASTCRNHGPDRLGDYECRAWDTLTIGSVPVAPAPLCDFGTQMNCDFLQSAGYDCSVVGLSLNPTQMTCRNLSNNVLSNPYDPAGYCLDNTASGPVGP